MKIALLVFTLALLSLTACAGEKTVASSTPASAVSPPAPSPIAAPSKIGDTIFSTDKDEFTVYSLISVKPTEFWKPASGMRFVAINVKEKAGPNGLDANPFDFEITMTDDSRYQSYIGVKEPPLHATKLGAGQAVRGWITFEVTASGAIDRIVLRDSTDIFWQVA